MRGKEHKPAALSFSSEEEIPVFLKYFMAVACGIVVANLYYCQPLLGALSDTFHVSESGASWINICSQLGYGLGLFFIVPLGDMIPRRRLLVWMHIMAAVAVAGAALSVGIGMLYFFSICIGLTSTACQVFVPLSAHLASGAERGKVIGTLMGGLLSGILLSRTLSGFIAELWGWRSMYWIASGMMVIMAFLVSRIIPGEKPGFKGSYKSLLRSLFRLIKTQKLVRESAWIGGCLFGAISAFWSTMAFFLEKPPYEYSLSVIGLFGIVGTAGALISPYVGTLSDQKGALFPMRWGFLGMLLGYLILFYGIHGVFLVIAGIVLIDMGLQAAHIPNLARISEILPEARTRINTIYMTSFFVGGTIGSIVGSFAWNAAGWTGVCSVGTGLVIAGGMPIFLRDVKKRKMVK